MGDALEWYDSHWLSRYLAAKQVVASVAPAKLDAFVAGFDVLRTDPQFEVKEVRGLFDDQMLAEIRRTARAVPPSQMEAHEIKLFGRMVVHDHPVFTEIQHGLVERMSALVGEAVEPTYNFFSMYSQMGVCPPHLDSPSAKWTLDVCIDQSEPWPIYFSQVLPWPEQRPALGEDWQAAIKSMPDLVFQPKVLQPGNAVVFSGSSQWHYREAVPRGVARPFCDLLFFHFMPKGAKHLLKPANWARLFGIPELAELPGIDVQC